MEQLIQVAVLSTGLADLEMRMALAEGERDALAADRERQARRDRLLPPLPQTGSTPAAKRSSSELPTSKAAATTAAGWLGTSSAPATAAKDSKKRDAKAGGGQRLQVVELEDIPLDSRLPGRWADMDELEREEVQRADAWRRNRLQEEEQDEGNWRRRARNARAGSAAVATPATSTAASYRR
jgi:hypothetical protein